MAGVKGRSGRKTMRNEEKRLRVIDRAWEIAEEYLNDPAISNKEKMATVEKIITKDIPQGIDLEGGVTHTIFFKELEEKVDKFDDDGRET